MVGIQNNFGLRSRKLLLNTMSEKASLRKEIGREKEWAIPRSERVPFPGKVNHTVKEEEMVGETINFNPISWNPVNHDFWF